MSRRRTSTVSALVGSNWKQNFRQWATPLGFFVGAFLFALVTLQIDRAAARRHSTATQMGARCQRKRSSDRPLGGRQRLDQRAHAGGFPVRLVLVARLHSHAHREERASSPFGQVHPSAFGRVQD